MWIGNQDEPAGVWFQGNDLDDLQCVGLGGSRHHVIGENVIEKRRSYSRWPTISEALEDHRSAIADSIAQGDLPKVWPLYLEWRGGRQDRDLLRDSQMNWRPLEFLAIPLAETNVNMSDGLVHVVLGTPLYVAVAGMSKIEALLGPETSDSTQP
jgi:hypothetical protein